MNKLLTGIVASIVGLFGLFAGTELGGTSPGQMPTTATSSSRTLAIGAHLLFPTSTPSCVARVITTQGDALKITFFDVDLAVPSHAIGHVLAASSTATFDSTVYGCGALRAYSYGVQTVTLTETR